MVELLPYLSLGTQRDARNEQMLRQYGITHLLCVAEGFRFPNDPVFSYHHVPLSDEGYTELRPSLDTCVNLIENARETGGKILLFCRRAQNRSPTIAIAYFMITKRYTLRDAYTFVQNGKSDISPHESYFKQLQDLDRELHGTLSMSEDDRGGSVQAMIRKLRDDSNGQ